MRQKQHDPLVGSGPGSDFDQRLAVRSEPTYHSLIKNQNDPSILVARYLAARHCLRWSTARVIGAEMLLAGAGQ